MYFFITLSPLFQWMHGALGVHRLHSWVGGGTSLVPCFNQWCSTPTAECYACVQQGGILTGDSCGTAINHAILVVGYNMTVGVEIDDWTLWCTMNHSRLTRAALIPPDELSILSFCWEISLQICPCGSFLTCAVGFVTCHKYVCSH